MSEENRTLKEWRELRGLSREELAEKAGVSVGILARLEEVGEPYADDTVEGDAFLQLVTGPIMSALGLEEVVVTDVVPKYAAPGDLVLDPGGLAELDESVWRFLIEHAEEINLRVAVPNRWDVGLKRHQDVSEADAVAIHSYLENQGAYKQAAVDETGDIVALLQEYATEKGQKTGDVLEPRGGRWVPKSKGSEEEDE
jgi:transcriptional regulator with XRE-family HTH domain